MSELHHSVPVPAGFDLIATLGVLRRGGGDPTWRLTAPAPGRSDCELWKVFRTPEGPVTLRLRTTAPDDNAGRGSETGTVEAWLWGCGSRWLNPRLPALLGGADDPAGFRPDPAHDALVAAARRFHGWRIPRTGLVVEALVPAVIEQRVTGREAFGSYRRLIRRWGQPAPGPGADLGLWAAPSPQGWARIPSWEWLRAGVDAGRADAVMRAVRSAGALENLGRLHEPEDARRALMTLPGIGVWTAAEVAQRAWGDADAVSFGDYHVPRDIGMALTGAAVDDTGLERLLRPYAGHRYRVQRLVELAGLRTPRRGPRRSLPTHLPTRWR